MADEEKQSDFGEDRNVRRTVGLSLFDLRAIVTTLIYCRMKDPSNDNDYMIGNNIRQATEEADQLLSILGEGEPEEPTPAKPLTDAMAAGVYDDDDLPF